MTKIDANNSSSVPGAASPHILPALPYSEIALDDGVRAELMAWCSVLSLSVTPPCILLGVNAATRHCLGL